MDLLIRTILIILLISFIPSNTNAQVTYWCPKDGAYVYKYTKQECEELTPSSVDVSYQKTNDREFYYIHQRKPSNQIVVQKEPLEDKKFLISIIDGGTIIEFESASNIKIQANETEDKPSVIIRPKRK
jgi:hypothetical protein